MGLSPANPHTSSGMSLVGEPLRSASIAVVAVHGRDQEPQWMLDHLVSRLDLPGAAYILPTIEGGSWYPNRFFDPAAENEPWITHALERFGSAVALAGDAGVPVQRVLLTGFSQGACLVAEMLVRDVRPYAGVAVLTGGFMGSDEELVVPPEPLEGMPVLITGHVDDSWVPVPRVERTAELLREAGAQVELAIHDDPEHGINDDEVAAVRRMLVSIGA